MLGERHPRTPGSVAEQSTESRARYTPAGRPQTARSARRGRYPPCRRTDSGIRSGADVVKALALGATAVGIGRPYAYGRALGGTDGIVHVLRALLGEADLIMAVDGYRTLDDLVPEALQAL